MNFEVFYNIRSFKNSVNLWLPFKVFKYHENSPFGTVWINQFYSQLPYQRLYIYHGLVVDAHAIDQVREESEQILNKHIFTMNRSYLVDQRMFFSTTWVQKYLLSLSNSPRIGIATVSMTKFYVVLIKGFVLKIILANMILYISHIITVLLIKPVSGTYSASYLQIWYKFLFQFPASPKSFHWFDPS